MGQLFGFSELRAARDRVPLPPDHQGLPAADPLRRRAQHPAGKATIEGVTAQDLVKTSAQSWAETDLTLKGPIKFDEGKDTHGPDRARRGGDRARPGARARRPVAVARTGTASPSSRRREPPKAPEGRVVAVGDADFASNSLLGFQGNQDFFLNTVAWLAEDADLISIRPKEPENQALFLSRQAQQNVAWLALVILPGLFVVAGVVGWWRRR